VSVHSLHDKLASRLTSLNAHDALFILKNCFSIPKLLYSLRCASCFNSNILSEYDEVVQITPKVILNVDLSDIIWKHIAYDFAAVKYMAVSASFWPGPGSAFSVLSQCIRTDPASIRYRVVYTRCTSSWQPWSCLHCGMPRVADKMRCSSTRAVVQKVWDVLVVMQAIIMKGNISSGVSCKKPSRVCQTYCGCCSSFWRLPAWTSIIPFSLVAYSEAQWRLTAYILPCQCHNTCTCMHTRVSVECPCRTGLRLGALCQSARGPPFAPWSRSSWTFPNLFGIFL